MAPERATGLPTHVFTSACPSKHATLSISKGEFSVAAYPRSPAVAGPLLEPSTQASSLYTFITCPCPALLPNHSPMA
jgi:hypothetical protein